MNHRKIRSEGYIPFSWEEKPGIPKIKNHHKSCSDMGMGSNDIKMLSEHLIDKKAGELSKKNVAPPPPPPCTVRKRGLRWQDDPFLAALKSCSKGDAYAFKQKSSFFSCKSCNVVDDNLVKFSKLPPIPKERYYARSFVRNSN